MPVDRNHPDAIVLMLERVDLEEAITKAQERGSPENMDTVLDLWIKLVMVSSALSDVLLEGVSDQCLKPSAVLEMLRYAAVRQPDLDEEVRFTKQMLINAMFEIGAAKKRAN